MKDPISRSTVEASFGPLVPIITDVVQTARAAVTYEVIRDAVPEIGRPAAYNRIRGYTRWLFIAEELVRRVPSMPTGFGGDSTEKHHNQGRYSFQWPLGLVTVRREPHEEDSQGLWFQERLDDVFEQLPLAAGVNAEEGVKAFISVPADGLVSVVFTHPTFEEPMSIALDEFGGDETVPLPKTDVKKTKVRSSRKDENAGSTDKGRDGS